MIISYSYQKQVSSVELMEGDTIVMGSDGLYDNVFDHEIVSTMDIFTDVAEAGICFIARFIYQKISDSVVDTSLTEI